MNNETDYSFLGVEGLTGNRQVKVTNMGRAAVGYTIKELNLRRDFRPNFDGQAPDSKIISFDELFRLNNIKGGPQLIYDNLLIEDNDVRYALGLPTIDEAPEYEYTRDEVFEILEKGDTDEILDMLEFGPYYIAQWVKEDIINIDSSKTRRFIGSLFDINIEQMEDLVRWSAEGDSEEGTSLGYGTIKGLQNTSKVSNGRRARRADKVSPVEEGETPQLSRRRRK